VTLTATSVASASASASAGITVPGVIPRRLDNAGTDHGGCRDHCAVHGQRHQRSRKQGCDMGRFVFRSRLWHHFPHCDFKWGANHLHRPGCHSHRRFERAGYGHLRS
jgi:hypothetical protein